jgi:transposase-like protein
MDMENDMARSVKPKASSTTTESETISTAPEPEPDVEIVMEPEPKTNTRRRLSPEDQEAIIAGLQRGDSVSALSKRFSTSYTTILNYRKKINPITMEKVGQSVQKTVPQPTLRSDLHNKIFLVGFRTVYGETIDPSEITELKAEIDEKEKQSRIQFALSL